MGNCNFKNENFDDSSCNNLHLISLAINKSHFKFHCIIGKGGFGKVKIETHQAKYRYGR